jgi:hypothetical protein
LPLPLLWPWIRVAISVESSTLISPGNDNKAGSANEYGGENMSGHGHGHGDGHGDGHHAEDTTVPMKVGIFLICTFAVIVLIAIL